jgi:death-on-curing protein
MTERRIRFLSVEDVLRAHRLTMLDEGVEPLVRNLGLLESVLAMPQQESGEPHLHPDVPAIAAAYAFHIASNRPFADGNVRAAIAAMIQFLSDNGWSCDAPAADAEPGAF